MAPSVLQTGGFILGVVGAAALIAATAMNNWSVKDRQGDVVTSVYTYKGLWRDCETTSSGLTECRPLYGLLGFSGTRGGSGARVEMVGVVVVVVVVDVVLLVVVVEMVGMVDGDGDGDGGGV